MATTKKGSRSKSSSSRSSSSSSEESQRSASSEAESNLDRRGGIQQPSEERVDSQGRGGYSAGEESDEAISRSTRQEQTSTESDRSERRTAPGTRDDMSEHGGGRGNL